MIQLVQKYNTYLRSIPELISKTHYKAAYFQKILGLKRPTYYRKLRYNAFNSIRSSGEVLSKRSKLASSLFFRTSTHITIEL